jgi:hypothetical protein
MAQDLAALARRFTSGADEFVSSPVSRQICLTVGADAELLAIAANCRAGQQPTNLFLAAVHYLLLGGTKHELGLYYASITEHPLDPAAVGLVLRTFCLEHRAELIDLLRVRLVQTNVVRRSGALRLGLAAIARQETRPVALMEIGCSAGVHLCFERYRYEVAGRVWGDRTSELTITSEWRSEEPPPDLDHLPEICARAGIDLNPVDPRDTSERRWLQALIWPENRPQSQLLDRALAIVAADPPCMVAGDALDLAAEVAANLCPGQPLVVFHAATRYHVPRSLRQHFDECIAALGQSRSLYWLSLEGPLLPEPRMPVGVPLHVLALRQIGATARSERHLALVAGHAEWIQPLDV